MGEQLITSYAHFPSFFHAAIIAPEQVRKGLTVVAGVPMTTA